MFTLHFLKNLNKDDLKSSDVQNDIVCQLRFLESAAKIADDNIILDTIDDIEKSIGLLSCLEYENKQKLVPDTIDIIEEEIKILIKLLEKKNSKK